MFVQGLDLVCSTVKLQRYMFVRGLEMPAVCKLQLYTFVQGLELSAVH